MFYILFQLEQLYIEVMYTITNKVGASSGQFSHYQEDLYSYAQKAFGVSNEQHRKYLAIASEEKVNYLWNDYRWINHFSFLRFTFHTLFLNF